MAKPFPLILASSSPRRKWLLERQGWAFVTMPAEVAEYDTIAEGPAALVRLNAQLKGEWVRARVAEASLVIAADTAVALGDKIFNKPVDLDQARAMLRQLSGQEHRVYTGVYWTWATGKVQESYVEQSRVTFKQLSDEVIESYLRHVNPLDKAGAYSISEYPELVIDHYDGSYSNIMGLPMAYVKTWLSQQLCYPIIGRR